MLIMAAEGTAGLKRAPRPFVLQTALGDYAVQYQLNAYLDNPKQRVPTLALLHSNIQDIFNEHSVQIMTPHYMADPPEPQVVPKGRWFDEPASPAEDMSPEAALKAKASF